MTRASYHSVLMVVVEQPVAQCMALGTNDIKTFLPKRNALVIAVTHGGAAVPDQGVPLPS